MTSPMQEIVDITPTRATQQLEDVGETIHVES